MVRLSAVRYGPPTLRDISPIGRIGPIRDRPQSAIWSLRGSLAPPNAYFLLNGP
jgi:hypothetical protein